MRRFANGWALLWLLFTPSHVFLVSIFTIALSGRWRVLAPQLLRIEWLAAGVLAGCALYLVSLTVAQARLPSAPRYLKGIANRLLARPLTARRVVTLGLRAIYEEAFWRGTVQFLLGSGWAAIAVVSITFTVQHLYYWRLNNRSVHPRIGAEFLLFSVLMGVLYAGTGQLLFVAGVHWTRNLLIASRVTGELTPPPGRWPARS